MTHANVKKHEILVLLFLMLLLRQVCCHVALIHVMLDQNDMKYWDNTKNVDLDVLLQKSAYIMPRPCKVPVEIAVKVIKQFINHLCTKELPLWSSEVWKLMSNAFKDLGYDWDHRCVYTNVIYNRRNILTQAREEMGIEQLHYFDQNNNDFDIESIQSDFDKHCDSNNSEDWSPKPKRINESIKYIVLTEDQWNEIKPTDGTQPKLQPGTWTNIIALALWAQFRMPCAFIFKKARVRKAEDEQSYLINFAGICKSKVCSNTIKGLGEKKPNEEGITFAIETRDTRYDKHEIVKRPFNGQRRQEAFHALKTEGSEKYRKYEARQLMLPGDVEPPILPSSDVLRQAKKEGIDKNLGIDKLDSRDIVRSIEDMNLSPQYCRLIQEVGGLPFRVLYGSPTQFHLYQEYRRLKRNWPTIYVDATGSLVKKLQRKNGIKSGHIFLYVIVINFNGTTACVYQMLSERHDSVTIMLWFLRWIQNGAHIPKEAICDYSRALLMGMSMAFNKQPIKTYISDRFRTISSSCRMGKEPNTFIRIDVAHFIHMICRWKCFKSIRQRAIKDFFLRCVTLMVTCTTLSQFQQVFECTCAVALHTYEDSMIDLINDISTPKEARKKLESYISKRNINDDLQNYDNEEKHNTPFHWQFDESNGESEPEMDIISEGDQSIESWINNLITKNRKILIVGENLNAFYLPDFIDRFAPVAKEFPLWTTVGMSQETMRATSSYVEGYFNDLKTRTLKHYKLPISVHKFIREHIKDIEETNCIMSGKIIQHNNDLLHKNMIELVKEDEVGEEIKITETENVKNIANYTEISSVNVKGDSDLFVIENWRGKADALYFNNDQKNTDGCEVNTSNISTFSYKISAIEDTVNSINTTQKDIKNSAELHIDTHKDYMHSENSSSTNNYTELTYRKFESNLNEHTDFSSTIIKAVEPSQNKLSMYTGKYFKPYPEIQQENAFLTKNKSIQRKKITLLSNGSLCPAVVMKNYTYFLQNTCSFDSVVQILATAGIDNVQYYEFLQNTTNSFLQFVYAFITNGVTKSLLAERVRILSHIYEPKIQGTIENKIIYKINAENSIANMIKDMLSSDPSRYDIENCSACGRKTILHPIIAPNHNILWRKSFTALQEALEFDSPICNINCHNNCPGRFTRTSNLNNHIIIELDIRHKNDFKKSLKCSLGEFPTIMYLGTKNQTTKFEYRLAGVVEYIPGHYIAYSFRNGGFWQKYNDMDHKISISHSRTRIEPHVAIYIRANKINNFNNENSDVINSI